MNGNGPTVPAVSRINILSTKDTNLDIIHEEDVGVDEDARLHIGEHEVNEETSSGAHPEQELQILRRKF